MGQRRFRVYKIKKRINLMKIFVCTKLFQIFIVTKAIYKKKKNCDSEITILNYINSKCAKNDAKPVNDITIVTIIHLFFNYSRLFILL